MTTNGVEMRTATTVRRVVGAATSMAASLLAVASPAAASPDTTATTDTSPSPVCTAVAADDVAWSNTGLDYDAPAGGEFTGSLAAPGVLANDDTCGGSAAPEVLVTPACVTGLAVGANGSFSFASASCGVAFEFTYRLAGVDAGSATATVTVVLDPVTYFRLQDGCDPFDCSAPATLPATGATGATAGTTNAAAAAIVAAGAAMVLAARGRSRYLCRDR